MSFSVSNQLVDAGDSVYYEEAFMVMIESCLPYIKTHQQNKIVTVTEEDTYKFEGDFYGLLASYDVPLALRWIYLRVNGYNNSSEYHRQGVRPTTETDSRVLIFPYEPMIEELRNAYVSSQQK